MRQLVVLSIAIAGVLLMGAGGIAVADSTTAAQENESVSAGPYELEDLQRGGVQQDHAPPSVRAWGSTGTMWIEVAPRQLFSSTDPENREDLQPGQTVDRDRLWLRSTRAWDAEPSTVEIIIVYWEYGEQRIEREGGYETVSVAQNQTVDSYEVEIGPGYDVSEIELREFHDDSVQATMWVEGQEGIRWRFEQSSSEATQEIPISTRGDAVLWGFWWLILPGFVTAIGMVMLDRKLLDAAIARPGYSWLPYLLVIAFGGFWTAILAYDWLMETLAGSPWLLGVGVGLVVGVLIAELFGEDTKKDLFWRFDLEESEVAEDGSGILKVEAEEKPVVELEDGQRGIIERGFRQFYARARGAVPKIDVGSTRETTQIDVDGKWDRLHLVDPSADEPIEYEKPKWELGAISFDRDADGWKGMVPTVEPIPVTIAAVVLLLGWSLGSTYLNSSQLGVAIAAVPALAIIARPTGAKAHVDLAPAHFDSVVANMLKLAQGFEETADREYYKNKYHQEKGRNLADRKVEQEEGEQSRMQAVMDKLAPPPEENGDEPEVADD